MSESALAETEYAAWMKMNAPRVQRHEHYEIRPCKRVRGFMLRLPGIGWRLWFSTVRDAANFASRATSIYDARCHVYDSAGQQVAWIAS